MRLCWLVVLAGCRFHFDPLGATPDAETLPDAPPCQFGSWGAPHELTGLDSATTDTDASLSADGLTMYFSSDRAGTYDVFVTTRATRQDTWVAPIPVPELATSSSEESNPSISANGLELYFGQTAVFRLTRATTTSPWGAPAVVIGPTGAFSSPMGADIAADGLTLYFCARPQGNPVRQLYRAQRAAASGVFDTPSRLPTSEDTLDTGFPTVSANGLELFYSRGSEVLTMTRATTADEFGNETAVSALDVSPLGEGDPEISADGLTMTYGTEQGTTGWDLFEATRVCQ